MRNVYATRLWTFSHDPTRVADITGWGLPCEEVGDGLGAEDSGRLAGGDAAHVRLDVLIPGDGHVLLEGLTVVGGRGAWWYVIQEAAKVLGVGVPPEYLREDIPLERRGVGGEALNEAAAGAHVRWGEFRQQRHHHHREAPGPEHGTFCFLVITTCGPLPII